jgi:hypothetical protein
VAIHPLQLFFFPSIELPHYLGFDSLKKLHHHAFLLAEVYLELQKSRGGYKFEGW